jgi:hypothetical protein
MPRKSTQLYNIHREADGAQVGTGVDLDTARSEVARLNAEAKVTNPDTGKPTAMYLGEVCRYEIRSTEGLVVK